MALAMVGAWAMAVAMVVVMATAMAMAEGSTHQWQHANSSVEREPH